MNNGFIKNRSIDENSHKKIWACERKKIYVFFQIHRLKVGYLIKAKRGTLL